MRLFRFENNVISTPRFDNAGHGNLPIRGFGTIRYLARSGSALD